MPTAQPRDAALDAAAADSRALRAALGETASWRAQAEALARELVEATLDSRGPLFEVQRAFAIFPPGSPAGDSLFRLAEALPRIPDRPSRIAMLADRVPALRGWKAAAALPFASVAMHAIGRQFVYAETIAAALRRAERDARGRPARRFSFDMLGEGARTAADADRRAAGEGRLLGRRGQAGARARPCALSGIHRQAAHRPVVSRLRPASLGRTGRRPSPVRHAQPRDARMRARACRSARRRLRVAFAIRVAA